MLVMLFMVLSVETQDVAATMESSKYQSSMEAKRLGQITHFYYVVATEAVSEHQST